MARQHTALALFCSSAALALAVVACDGDDTNPAPVDAGVDATTSQDAGKVDSGTDAGVGSEDAGPCTPYDAAGLSDAAIHEGISIVVAEHCQVCHGESLSGNQDGVNSPGYGTAYPPNLTPDRATGLGCWSDQQIENAFLHGIDDNGNVLCPPMPHFGEEEGGISAAEAPAVVAFLRSLPAITATVPASPNCSLPPDGGVDAGEPTDAGGHHHDGGFDNDAGEGEGGATDASADATSDAAAEDAGSDDAG